MSTANPAAFTGHDRGSLLANRSGTVGNPFPWYELIFNAKFESSTFRIRLLEMRFDEAKRFFAEMEIDRCFQAYAYAMKTSFACSNAINLKLC